MLNGIYLQLLAVILSLLLVLFSPAGGGVELLHKGEVGLRLDKRSHRDTRAQYRLRYYNSLLFAKNWSLNSFLATGNGFASSHNTFNANKPDHLYFRRLYLRYQNDESKTEIGVLPTYKGRVSSTGLSKDGWLRGLRQVVRAKNGQLELVLAELSQTKSRQALGLPEKLNYVELEYSFDLSQNWSAEMSLEHMFAENFLRAELRYQKHYALELIYRTDNQQAKAVASYAKTLSFLPRPTKLMIIYSYIHKDFGTRAELTEDFVDFGHALALELESNYQTANWFTKAEFNQGQSRFQLGLKYKF